MVWSILSSFGIFVIRTYIYIYLCVRRPRDNPLSGHVSRAPRCRTPIRPAIYADRVWRERRGGLPRLNTEYENDENVCRLEFDFAIIPRSEGGLSPLLRNRIASLSLLKIFLLLQRRRGGGEGLSKRYLERLRYRSDHRPLPP